MKWMKRVIVFLLLIYPIFAQFQLPFYDNFDDNDDSDWTWYVSIGPTPGGNPSHVVVNGVEVITTHDQNATLLANGLSNLSNYTVEADARITHLLDDVYGGIYLYAYNRGGLSLGNSFYILSLCHRCSRWRIGVKYSDGSGEVIAQGDINIELNRWYRVKLSVRGDTIAGYIDGQLLGEGVASHPLQGGGFFGFGGADDIIEIDNVEVYSSTFLINPPTVSTPTGPSSGSVGDSLIFQSIVTDPDGDQVSIQFDWGDGELSEWSDYYPSGHTFDVTHSWSRPGTYHVRARGRDSNGNIGNWSSYITVIISPGPFHLPFSDNFDDGDDSDWLWYTYIGQNPGGEPSHQVVNGAERIITHDQNNTLFANGTSNLSNYYVEADMRVIQLLDDAYGGLRIYAYANGGIGDTSSYYVLDICHRENRWGLGAHYSDGSSESLAHGSLNVSMNHWYHMKLEVREDTVFAYLDGQMLGWGVPSQPLSGGFFGFGGADDIIEIDNVYVYSSITGVSEPLNDSFGSKKIYMVGNIVTKNKPYVRLDVGYSTLLRLRIFDPQGREVTEYVRNFYKGINFVDLPETISNVPGVYFLIISDLKSKDQKVFRFISMRER